MDEDVRGKYLFLEDGKVYWVSKYIPNQKSYEGVEANAGDEKRYVIDANMIIGTADEICKNVTVK